MKSIVLAALLLSGAVLRAESLVVYAKGDHAVIGPGAPTPADSARAAFLAGFRADLARPQAFVALPLTDFPQWGRTVPGAHGEIRFHLSFPGGFVVWVALQGLAPNHRYILTLNGNPERAGNNRLADPVPGNEKERYYDFLTATTDARGRYEAACGILLHPGPYDVRFYVKDTGDFKIVLYHDFFRFTVD